MSVQPVNMPLGLGTLYIKRTTDAAGKYLPVGELKGTVSFQYTMETVQAKPGNLLGVVRRDKVAEMAQLKATICDFKIAQMIYALGLSTSLTQLTNTSTLRALQELALGSTTTTKTLSHTAASLTNVGVRSMDESINYVKGTHFSLPSTRGLKPLTSTLANKTARVSYDFHNTASLRAGVGNKYVLQIVSLKFVHKLSTGKFVQLEIPRATVMGGLTIPFGERDYTVYDITFEALQDTTASNGVSLFKIIREV